MNKSTAHQGTHPNSRNYVWQLWAESSQVVRNAQAVIRAITGGADGRGLLGPAGDEVRRLALTLICGREDQVISRRLDRASWSS